jgi:hypothetical protein
MTVTGVAAMATATALAQGAMIAPNVEQVVELEALRKQVLAAAR